MCYLCDLGECVSGYSKKQKGVVVFFTIIIDLLTLWIFHNNFALNNKTQ